MTSQSGTPDLTDRLQGISHTHPGHSALETVTGQSLTFSALDVLLETLADALRARGVARRSVVLIALPTGPDALIALLATMRVGIAFPVTLYEDQAEFRRILEAARPEAVLTTDQASAALVRVAEEMGIAVLKLRRTGEDLAALSVEGSILPPEKAANPLARPEDILWIATSGTVSGPRTIAISHESILTSVDATARWLNLTPGDRSLCVMPIYHLHAIYRSILPAMLSGATVIMTPGFNAHHIVDWIHSCAPTIMTAVPDMHRTLLEKLIEGGRPETGLRLLGTGSAPLPADLASGITSELGLPLYEFYGQTETAPLLAISDPESTEHWLSAQSTPWTLAIADDAGRPLDPGQSGELIAKGGLFNDVIVEGRRQPPPTTTDGWVRTGDIGILDAKGHLTLKGRLAETINKAGVKIDPLAVEQALCKHPDIIDAAAFGASGDGDKKLVVVLYVAGTGLPPEQADRHLTGRIAHHMMPDRLIQVDAIPKNQVGKVSRSQLAELFASGQWPNDDDEIRDTTDSMSFTDAPQSAESVANASVQAAILAIFEEAMGSPVSGTDAGFFAQGGDSFSALHVILEIEKRFGLSLAPAEFIANDTAAALANLVGNHKPSSLALEELVLLNAGSLQPPVFLAPFQSGDIGVSQGLAKAFGEDRPVYALIPGRDPETGKWRTDLGAIARYCLALVQKVQPEGPYHILGHSFGAHVAFEMVKALSEQGEPIGLFGVIDDDADVHKRRSNPASQAHLETPVKANGRALAHHIHKPYSGPITLFRSNDWYGLRRPTDAMDWEYLTTSGVNVYSLAGDHKASVRGDNPSRWGALVASILEGEPLASDVLPDGLDFRGHFAPRAELMTPPVFKAMRAGRLDKAKQEVAAWRRAGASKSVAPDWMAVQFANALGQVGEADEQIGILAALLSRSQDPVYIAALLISAITAAQQAVPSGAHMTFSHLRRQIRWRRLRQRAFQSVSRAPVTNSLECCQKSRFYRHIGDHSAALEWMQRALEMKDLPQHRLDLARMHVDHGRLAPALDLVKPIEPDIPNKTMFCLWGQVLFKLDLLDDALTCFEKAMGDTNTQAKAHIGMADVWLARSDSAKARDHFRQACAYDARLDNPKNRNRYL